MLQACLACLRVYLNERQALVAGAYCRRKADEDESQPPAAPSGGGTVRMNLAAALIVSSAVEIIADISNATRECFRPRLIQVKQLSTPLPLVH